MFRILISKVVVLTITAGLLAFGVYGSVNIVQRFVLVISVLLKHS